MSEVPDVPVQRLNLYVTIHDPDGEPQAVTVPMGARHPAIAMHFRADGVVEQGEYGLEVHVAWASVQEVGDIASLLHELATHIENSEAVVSIDPNDYGE